MTTFADRSGDSSAAIDVTAVTVATDAREIVLTQRLRSVGAPPPLFAFAPEYGFGFSTRDSLGRLISGVATTVVGNSDETRLDVYDVGGEGYTYLGTRTVDQAASTVTLRFPRTDDAQGALATGAVWTNLSARNRFQQDVFSHVDTAAAAAGTSHVVGG